MARRLARFIYLFFCTTTSVFSFGQGAGSIPASGQVERPRLVIGIVVDQMRWDYLYRYYDRYQADGGFKRLLSQGFSCENTLITYAPTVTACGHSSIYTGSVPAITGITGNEWWDYNISQMVYCVQDDNAKTVGGTTDAGKMSPNNLLVTTIGDELRLAANFSNKVIGIAIKDRAAILPAGHTATGAYWYDAASGNWITSSYYMSALPEWVKDLNAKKLPDSYFSKNWNTLYPLETYRKSAPDEESYEFRPFGANQKGFPYNLSAFVGKNYGVLPATPYGNTYTLEMARAAVVGEKLGSDSSTDLLTVSLSTPDYIGHTFGPNSVEQEDDYLRLDRDLGEFFSFLDKQIGKGQYLVFLSADHGVAHVPQFLKEHKVPAGAVDMESITGQLNTALKSKFGVDKLVIGIFNSQVFLNRDLLASSHIDKGQVNRLVIDLLSHQPGIARALPLDSLQFTTLNTTIKEILQNGYYPSRCGDIDILLDPQWIEGFPTGGTTHGVWNPYDSHIPLLWFGWHIQPGKTNRKISITDIAPTVAALLHIQMPSGSIGNVIEEVSR